MNRAADLSPTDSWMSMLRARPQRNTAAAVKRTGDGALSIAVRTRRTALRLPPLRWLVPVTRERTAVLDRLGEQVWDLCDGSRTVEQVVEQFAQQHALTFHEARVSVTSYLGPLIRRGVLAIEMVNHETD
jgi:hypothetical protein